MGPHERKEIGQKLSAGIGIVQPCALATSKATPIGEIVSVSWYDDS
jgi:hypothetical protein